MVLRNLRGASKLSIYFIICFSLWNLSDAARGFKRNFRNGMYNFIFLFF